MGKDIAIGLAHYIAKLNDNDGCLYLYFKDAHFNLKKDQLEGRYFFCSKPGNALVKNSR
jgi:hypothetical protein